MKLSQEIVSGFFDYGVDRQNRRILLFEDIDGGNTANVVKALLSMDSESHSEIELLIGSEGGSKYDALALYDILRTVKSPVSTVAVGYCYSAATLLVACGEEGRRFATPNTLFMVHEGSEEVGRKRYDELKVEASVYARTEKKWADLMERHTDRPAPFWMKICKRVGDTYFDAEQAREWGIIDGILAEKD